MRTLARLAVIEEVKPIDGADRIDAYRVHGWWVVDSKGNYNVGDKVIYIETDAWVPYSLCSYLSKGKPPKVYNGIEGNKLRIAKFKKQVSQGLLLPTTMLTQPAEVGDDVSEQLGIIKWEPVVPACLQGFAKGNFPSYCRKTDAERIENLVEEVFIDNKDSKYEVSLKLDGSSCSVYYNNGTAGVCSRNLDLKLDESNAGNTFVKTATSTGLLDALLQLKRNIQVCSELMGPGIQGNREKLQNHTLYIFDIFCIDTQKFYSPDERFNCVTALYCYGYTGQHVPVIFSDMTLADLEVTSVETSKKLVDRPSINNSIAEGCVFKRMDGQFSFKSINLKFLFNERD